MIPVWDFQNQMIPVRRATDISVVCSALEVSDVDRSGGVLLTGGFVSEFTFRAKIMAMLFNK